MNAPVTIDIGPTAQRDFVSPRDIFERLAANDETASVGHIRRMDQFSQNRGGSCHIHGLTLKVSGSPIIIPADLASLAEPIAIMARAHAADPNYGYDDCRVILTFSQKPILAGQTNNEQHSDSFGC